MRMEIQALFVVKMKTFIQKLLNKNILISTTHNRNKNEKNNKIIK